MTVVAEGLQPLNAQGADSVVADQPCGEAGLEPQPEPIAAPITRARFLDLVDSCVRHLAAWLDAGSAPERSPGNDVAAAENSRVQIWQWLHSDGAALDDGTPIDFALFDAAILRVGERLPRRGLPGQGNVLRAAWLLAELTYAGTLADSLTAAAPARGG